MDYTEFKQANRKKKAFYYFGAACLPLFVYFPLFLIGFIFPFLWLFLLPLLVITMIIMPFLLPFILKEKEKRDRQKAQYIADAMRGKTVIDKRG